MDEVVAGAAGGSAAEVNSVVGGFGARIAWPHGFTTPPTVQPRRRSQRASYAQYGNAAGTGLDAADSFADIPRVRDDPRIARSPHPSRELPLPMPRLTYIANPQSVHLDVWLKASAACGIDVRIETASRSSGMVGAGIEVEHLVPGWLSGPSILRYLWAGLAARHKRRLPDEILQAHGASGNGLAAWMAGRPYIVTTYGSEVLAAVERGPIYRWLLHRVLSGADRITASSPQMVDVLMNEHGIRRERIHLLHLGIDTQLFHPVTDSARRAMRSAVGIGETEPVWISIKRAIPMNRTVEIVRAFERYGDAHAEGRLVIVCGDDVSSYTEQVQQLVDGSPHEKRILVLTEWLDPPAVARWLQLADFAIAVPTSDQMSNAVLEAMACGAVPLLLAIDGYRPLREGVASVHWIDECTVDSLLAALEEPSRT